MTAPDYRHASSATVAEALQSGAEVRMSDLQGALINALERIESLENYRDELEQLLQAFNEQMKAAKLHGAGLLAEQ